MKTPAAVIELAKKEGYEKAVYECHWKGAPVYSGRTEGDGIPCVGWPLFITLEEGKAPRVLSEPESREFMRACPGD